MGFITATKDKLWIRVLLGGPSGSGKTYSGLRLATGLAKASGSRIAAIDTENGRMKYYAKEFDFDYMALSAPFTPEKYISAIKDAVDAGYKVLLIDSSSHEWKWCYDTVNGMSGNSFQNWGKIKAQHHQKFTEAIIQSPIHIIVTARGKDEYVMEDKDGKKNPKKVGLGIKAEDDTEYEYTVTFNIAQDSHVATAMKDNTHLFETKYDKLTEDDGVALYDWANDGDAPAPIKPVANESEEIKNVVDEITSTGKSLFASGYNRDDFYKIVEENCGTKTYNKVKDIAKLNATLEAIRNIKIEEKTEE